MKVKPKEVLLNLPIVLMFDQEYKVPEFAANINQLVHGKVKVKYEELGILGEQYVGLFYLQRNDEFMQLRQEFVEMIEREQIRHHNMELAAKKAAEEQLSDQKVSSEYTCNGFCEAERGCPICWDPYRGAKS